MKMMRKVLLSVFMALTLLAGFVQVKPVKADYQYTIFVYSGKEGTFTKTPAGWTKVNEHTLKKTVSYGTEVTVDVKSYGLSINEPDKYYAKGVTIAGHDNDEVGKKTYQSYNFICEEDMSFSVAYGIPGGMVKYIVKYVSEDGEELYPTEEYYGMVGDKPVVSYQYVDGYLPNAYNQGKTLTDNAVDNVFTFTYYSIAGLEKPETIDEGITGPTEAERRRRNRNNENADNQNETAENANTNQNAEPANNENENGNGNNEPQEYVDLDDPNTPLAKPENENINDNKTPFANLMKNPAAVGGGAAGIGALLGILIFLLARRKKDKEEEEQ